MDIKIENTDPPEIALIGLAKLNSKMIVSELGLAK
jgi:hypothetical protein